METLYILSLQGGVEGSNTGRWKETETQLASIDARERNTSGGFRELSWNKAVYRYGRFIPGFPTLPYAGEGFRLKHDCGAREYTLRNVQILRPKRYR